MRILVIIGLILSFNICAMQGVQIKNIQHNGNLTGFILYEQGNGLVGYIVADCKNNIFGYGNSIEIQDSVSFDDFKNGSPNEKYALNLACGIEE